MALLLACCINMYIIGDVDVDVDGDGDCACIIKVELECMKWNN